MKKNFTFFLAALFAVSFATAQSLSEAIKLVDVDFKHNAADAAFKKLYEANSKDPEVIYWYVQSIIDGLNPSKEEINTAKQAIQKALNEGVNAPLLWVASGHLELLEGGDINSAKQKFEQAITATKTKKGENPEILTAIGRANADEGMKVGDANYGIEKLKRAGELNKTDPDIFINMGLCYRKLGSDYGGEAVKSFQEAIYRDPKNAKAYFQIGKIYASQNNKDALDENFNAALKADPTFAPAYLALFRYYSDKDVNKAKEYLDDFLKYADKDPANDLYYAEYLFRAGKYTESLAKAKEIDATTKSNQVPRLNMLYAYNYDRLNDSVQSKSYIDKFFAATKPADIQPTDYELAIKEYAKFPGSEAATIGFIEKAMANDSLKVNKISYANQAVELWGKAKNYTEQLKWIKKVIELKGTAPSEFDFYRMVSTAFNAKDYPQTMSIAKDYIAAFPDKPQGYGYNVSAAKAIDSTTALEPVLQQNEFYSKDLQKNKKAIFKNLYFLQHYYVDHTKELEKAVEVTDKMLELYPEPGEENKYAQDTKTTLLEGLNKQKSQGKSGGKSSGPKA